MFCSQWNRPIGSPFVLVFLFCFFLSCSEQLVIEVRQESDDPVSIENSTVNEYLSNAHYDGDYSYSIIQDFENNETQYRKDCPAYILLTWDNKTTNLLKKCISISDGINNYSFDLSIYDNQYELTNLIPNRVYSIVVSDYLLNGEVEVIFERDIKAIGQLRMLYIEGYKTTNFRDLGGWPIGDDKAVCYGKLIRGAEVFYKWDYATSISLKGISTLVNQVGVEVEIDFGDLSSSSPLEEYGVEFVHGDSYQILPYLSGLNNKERRQRYANCIRIIIQKLKEGKTVFFHCVAGADRTGTLAVIIEGLLGVTESDISKDYELTSFSLMSTPRYRSDEKFSDMIAYFKKVFSGECLSQSIYTFATTPVGGGGLGLTIEEINQLRELMIE